MRNVGKIKDPALLWQRNNNGHSPILHYCQPRPFHFKLGVNLLKKLDETTLSPLSQTQSEELFKYTEMMASVFESDEIRMLFEFSIIQKLPLVHPITKTILFKSETDETLMNTDKHNIQMKDIVQAQKTEMEEVCLTLILAQKGKWDNYFTLYELIVEGKANPGKTFFDYLLEPVIPNESIELAKIEDDYKYALKLEQHKQLWGEYLKRPENATLINNKKSGFRLEISKNINEAKDAGFDFCD